MHPLRFPNNGIKAKAVRKGVVGHGHATCRGGGQPWPKPLPRVASHGQGPQQRGCRLRPRQPERATGHPCKGLAYGRGCRRWAAAAHRGDAYGHGARRQAAYGQNMSPAMAGAARWNARRGGAHGGAARGRGAGHRDNRPQ
ncbi:hypothetical protein B296_00038501 [Ensete ventricosum]|uniref:Uncharacterized protein n=1 Tax=Ensete ventricosum TaxID=4639 RepID=A0A426X0B5_ENSVE|nr:hypothetical protein B296_00038501 [Ensete ventricosum]